MATEAAVSVTMAALSGANQSTTWVRQSGLLGSFDMLVMSNEVIGMAKYMLGGIKVTPETLAVDVIERVGPGGHYLAQDHTRAHFRTEMWIPTLMNRQMRRAWERAAARRWATGCGARCCILDHHEPMPIPEVEARLRS
jgi:trimethylamine--corrinoid protein Co-methyltransferase